MYIMLSRTCNGHSRSGRARAASQGTQHGDLGELLGRTVAVFGKPADVGQASQRPPCADEVAVDLGVIARDEVAKMLLVSERKVATSKSASPRDASDQSTTPVTSSPSTKTWSACRSPWMNTGVHGRRAVSASRRQRETRPAGRTSLATSHSHSPSRRAA